MLKIGEFSTLTGISIHMLRNYDKIGLLKPEQIDCMNNYRFYGEKQIVRANHIQVLKSLGFGLTEISEILKDGTTNDRIKTFLETKIKEKEESFSITERQIAQMHQALNELDMQNEYTLSVSVKQLSSHSVVSLRDIIREFTEEGLLWERLDMSCRANGIRLADVQYCMAMTHSVDYKNKAIDTEVFRVVDQVGPDIVGLRFSKMPETEAAVVAFQGKYSRLGDINRYMYHWIIENGYRISGKAFNIYYISPENEQNPENFVTEICYPIKNNS
ncbi:putative transcriptional regulator [Sphaerochaeta pleomorpha str. Grapes]|uniref:Putative transcriptional regulator n=1 Tax=Sphaerochaeta pleomorpha (strain ATCC BAA-1885 / DSM 22778 / Grapes) TaxID=158190 RepID=G8QTG3_SPHPG|nr:MerR family transcriptional regulator [Sphaerochaeta pleomorpha]AEV30204.1 putative transcriptional regulator [Sphaerochaeta pleomorpha str. Grapes]